MTNSVIISGCYNWGLGRASWKRTHFSAYCSKNNTFSCYKTQSSIRRKNANSSKREIVITCFIYNYNFVLKFIIPNGWLINTSYKSSTMKPKTAVWTCLCQIWSGASSSPVPSLSQTHRHRCARAQTTMGLDWMALDSLHVSRSQRMAGFYDTAHCTATSAHGSGLPRRGKYGIPTSATTNSAEQSTYEAMPQKRNIV